MPSKSRSSSAARTFELINAVAARGRAGVSLSALAKDCGIAVSSCHRYVATLEDLGVLERDGAGSIRLGPGLIALVHSYLDSDCLRQAARARLEDLVAKHGETCHLGRYFDGSVVYIDKVECDKSIRMVSRVGSRIPAHSSAMGKAIASKLAPGERERLIAGAKRRTEHTLLGEDLAADIAHAAERGWAIDNQENELGVRCVGAAILAADGRLAGALSMSGPASRFSVADCRRVAPELASAAKAIGARLL
ncbi:MAG: IclR family transcriptional regulator [Bifidobacteriaceae bacterium]|nr:IclR family transcriptional regulator [Bifidobacteriaceae bacterium]